MRIRYSSFLVVVGLSVALAGCAQHGGGYSTANRVDTAKVLDVQQVASDASWGPGAIIGGVAGVATGQGHSTESKLIRGAVGALAGGVVNRAVTSGRTEYQVLVQTTTGQQYRMAHGSGDLRVGDCVQVQHSGNTAKLYRTSQTQCNLIQ